MERLRRLLSGTAFDICAPTNEHGRCRVQEFLIDNAEDNPRGHARLKALLDDIAESGMDDLDISVCRHIDEGMFELKERGGLARIWCYIDPDRRRLIVMVLARYKNPGSGKKSKEQSQHIKLARQLCRQYKANPLPLEQ